MDFFVGLIEISVKATFLVLCILSLRMIKGVPHKVICLMWGMLAVRLVFPYSIPTKIPLLNGTYDIKIDESATTYITTVWIVGMVILFICNIVSYIRLRSKLVLSVPKEYVCDGLKQKVYFTETINTPILFGLKNAKIYIPFAMETADLQHIVRHEMMHKQRRDHIKKIVAMMLVCVYWFNPLFAFAFFRYANDIEMACDEAVTSQYDTDMQKDYARAMLECWLNQSRMLVTAVGFADLHTEKRIYNIMSNKKNFRYSKCLAGLCAALLLVTMLGGVSIVEGAQDNRRVSVIMNYVEGDSDEEGIAIKLAEYKGVFDRLYNNYRATASGNSVSIVSGTQDNLQVTVVMKDIEGTGDEAAIAVRLAEYKKVYDDNFYNYRVTESGDDGIKYRYYGYAYPNPLDTCTGEDLNYFDSVRPEFSPMGHPRQKKD